MIQPTGLKPHHPKSPPKPKERSPSGQNPPNKPTLAVGPAIIEGSTNAQPQSRISPTRKKATCYVFGGYLLLSLGFMERRRRFVFFAWLRKRKKEKEKKGTTDSSGYVKSNNKTKERNN
jgi:hypothetical protein